MLENLYTCDVKGDDVIFRLLVSDVSKWDSQYVSRCIKGIVDEVRKADGAYQKFSSSLKEATQKTGELVKQINYFIDVGAEQGRAILEYNLKNITIRPKSYYATWGSLVLFAGFLGSISITSDKTVLIGELIGAVSSLTATPVFALYSAKIEREIDKILNDKLKVRLGTF